LIKQLVWIAVAATILGRLLIEPRLDLPTKEGIYEAFAHLFVGLLLGAAWQLQKWSTPFYGWVHALRWAWKFNWYYHLAIYLSIFELVMFLLQKYEVI
jgi:hypothetical protein